MTIDEIFSEEELKAAASVPITDEILIHAVRLGTQAFTEFGYLVMEPIFRGQLNLSEREKVVGLCFYRLLGAVRTLSDLRASYQFQTMAGCTRLIFELCVDIGVAGRDLEKAHRPRHHGTHRRLSPPL